MAITLNGTTGITTPDVNSDGLTVDSTTLVVDEANNQVGIGTTSHYDASTKLTVDGRINVSNGTVTGSMNYGGGTVLNVGTMSNHNLQLMTNNTTRARIDSSGNLLVGTSSVISSSYRVQIQIPSTTGGIILKAYDTGTQYPLNFRNPANSTVGTIQTTNTGTNYNTTSDYRLKENVVGVTGASARVQQLNPVRFNFIANPDTTVDGFLAHEVQDVVPEAITGTKDAVDAEGNPEYQGIDQSKLVPLLTAALQEALTKIDSLETRIAALEAA